MKNNLKELKALKLEAYNHCTNATLEHALRIQTQIKSLETALRSETKSSAGDKHETGRAMVQLEREKLGTQLANVEQMQRTLQKIRTDTVAPIVITGSLVCTSAANYYIGISVGMFSCSQKKIYCISSAAPIAKVLLGKKIGDVITFNNTKFEILEIC